MNLGKYTANALVICIFPFLTEAATEGALEHAFDEKRLVYFGLKCAIRQPSAPGPG